ncbi:MAG: hypothetical protein K0S44_876 [Bacteroidetes bacterium]|jgi:hypothetical protein|nr:hypothetical protein [Bacteroidota bacterium]
MRNVLSVFLGVLTGIFIIFSLEIVNHIIYPIPQGTDLNDSEAIDAYTSSAPSIVFILLIISYSLGSLVGGLISSSLATHNKMTNSITTGGVLMGLGVYNLFMIPHPIWTIIISVFLFIPCSYLGGYWGIKLSSKNIRK